MFLWGNSLALGAARVPSQASTHEVLPGEEHLGGGWITSGTPVVSLRWTALLGSFSYLGPTAGWGFLFPGLRTHCVSFATFFTLPVVGLVVAF